VRNAPGSWRGWPRMHCVNLVDVHACKASVLRVIEQEGISL
jgi:hypothetical protein